MIGRSTVGGALAAGLLLVAVRASAATIAVTTSADELKNDGDCSLREAVRAASLNRAVDRCAAGTTSEDTIQLPAGAYRLTIRGAGENDSVKGDLDLSGTIAIVGVGAAATVIEGSALGERLLHVEANATVRLANLALEGGGAPGADGGAALIAAGGTLTLEDVVVGGNLADAGGGVAVNGGTLAVIRSTFTTNEARGAGGAIVATNSVITIVDSTLDGNSADGSGGGVRMSGGTLAIDASTIRSNLARSVGGGLALQDVTTAARNVTVSGNDAEDDGGGCWISGGAATFANVTLTRNAADADVDGAGRGGGIRSLQGATVTLQNTIMARNDDEGSAPECAGAVGSQGYNLVRSATGCTFAATSGDLVGADAGLLALADNGGPTMTHALGPASAARDAGSPAAPGSGGTTCEAADQRGGIRPGGLACDIGAFEEGTSPATTTTTIPGNTTTSVTGTTGRPTSTTTTTTSTTTTTITLPPEGLCPNGVPIDGAAIVISKLGGSSGNEAITISGRLQFPPGTPALLRPSATGMQVLVEDLGAPAVRYYDLSAVSHPIPRSDPRLRCRPKDGWRGLIYRNRSRAIDPPACTRGSALGLRKITLKDDRATSRGIAVTLVARGTRLDAPHGPLRLTIALGATGDDLLAGLCAVQQFSLRRCLSGGDRFACK